MRYEDASGTFQASGPIANDDSDTLTAGSRGPATGNLITGEGTQYGSAGADSAAGAQVTAIAGKGGEDSSFAGGKLSVTGEFGQLSVDAQGNYTYLANTGAPENVRDRFVYTLADDQGNSDTAALIVEIGKTPVAIKADAQQIVPGPDGVVTLPPGVELSDIMVVGRNLVVNLPDGTQLIIVDGAIFVPQLVLGGVEVPATNVAALLIGQEVQPAAGETPPSSGGNFAVPPPPLDPGVPLGDLIPPTEYNYIPPEPQEVFPEADDEDPEILIQPDGQPASVAAVDEVDERGLPTRNGGEPEGTGEGADGNASNDSDTSEATAGTIIINSPDGVDSVTIAGADGVPHEIVVGLVVQGEYGTLTITGIVGDDYTYSYVLDDNIDHSDGNPDQDDFSVVLTDDDGDTASATLTINILDDVPTAVDDTDTIAAGEFGPATGNVLTDADAGDAGDDDDGADTVGADDAELTNVTGFGDTEVVEGGWVVQGQYGVLTIGTDGSYSYVRNEGTPGGVEDVFTYTLTDGDTDTDTATLTITIENATPETGENPTALLDDDALEDGNPGTPAVGDDVDAANLTGFLAGSGGDGPLTFDLLLTGAPDGFSYVDGPDGAVHVMQGTTHVLTVTIDAATGEYEVSQINPIDHSAGGLENNAPFTINYTVTDQDDDSAPGTLTINVDDDTPVVTVELDREGAVTVDESGPTGASTIEFTGDEGDDGDVAGSGPIGRAVGSTAVVQASALFGADGPAADAELTYALALGSADTDLTLTDGSAIELQLIDGVVVGMVTEGDHEGDAAFAIAIDPATGVATVELYLSLDHPDDTNPNDSLPLGPNTVSVVVSATDGDNDTTESDPVDISGLFEFLDDGPTADGEANSAGAVTVDESGPTGPSTIEFTGDEGNDGDVDGSGPIGRAVGSASVVANAAAAFGADGPGGDDLSYALALGGSDTALTLTDGSAIELQLIDGVIVGMVTEGSHDGEAAFAIAIDPATGVATVELYLSLDHPDVNDPNDSLPLGPNTIDVVVTATDGDGDTADSDPIDISGLFNFLDDGPTVEGEVDEQGAVTVDESGPTGASTIEFTGDEGDDLDVAGSDPIGRAVGGTAVVNANALFGADGPSGADLSYALALGGSETALTLTDGSAIELQLVDGVIVGVVTEGAHDGDAAFAIAIDPNTGVATVELYLSLDHPDVTDDNDSLPLGPNTIDVVVTATDGDGDSVDSDPVDISGLFNFLDDGPSVEGRLSTEGPAIVDESPPVAAASINTDPYVKGDDPDLVGGQAIGSGSTTLLVPTADFGADGPAADDSLTFELTVINPSSGLTLTDGSEINLVLLESGVVVGVVSGGVFDGQAAFALSLDAGTGVVTAELYLSLDHPDDTDANDVLTLAAGSLGAVVVATDGDGDTATSAVIDVGSRIQFLDDGPSASNEPQQNVQEGNQTVTGTFDFVGGADGGSVTHINGIVLVFGGGDWSQWIPVDDGQIRAQADGSYEFQSDASGSGVTNGTFTVTDGDGDPVTANWSFNITDANAPTAGVSAARLDDDGLSGGNPLSTTGDIDANVGERPGEGNSEEDIFNGQLTLNFGGDGAGSVTFAAMDGQPGTVGTENVIYHWVGNTLTAEIDGGPRDGATLFDIVVDTATGEYTLTLRDNVVHANGGDETSAPNVELTYTVTDSDNSPAGGVNGTLNITFNDDAPTVTNVQGGGSVTLDETTAGTPAGFPIDATSLTAVITATTAFGADGPAAVGDTVYGLSLANGATVGTTLASGLQTAIGNHPITLTLTSSTTITGTYTDGGTQTAFTITMESDGKLTVQQEVPLEHLDTGDHNDSLDLVNGLSNLINATITIKDGDGDTHSGSTPIGDQIIFNDDGPDAATSGQAVGTVTLDESPEGDDTPGATAPFGEASATINFALNFVNGANVDYGADGPGSTAYSLQLTGDDVPSGLYALQNTDTVVDGDGYGQGAQIVLNQSGNVITGSVGDDEYFTIEINPDTGVVTFTQLNNIWNPTAGSSAAALDDTATLNTLAANLIQVIQTVTDADGDTDTAFINVGQGVFKIQDDGPEVTTAATDSDLDGDPLTATGDFEFDIGTDVPGGNASTYLSAALSGTVDGAAITVTQQPTFVSEVGGIATYEFAFTYDHDGDDATAEIENGGTVAFDLVNGGYTVTLDEDFSSTTVIPVSDVISRTGYNTEGSSPSQFEIVVSELDTADPIFVQFTAIKGPSNNTFTSGGNAAFAEGETFAGPQSWASISNTENGVAGDTIQSTDILNIDFFDANPRNPDATPNPAANPVTVEGLTLDLAKLGAGEDMVVLLKLVSASDPSDVTTRVVIIPYSEIYTEGETLPEGYTGTLGNDLGLVVIESNDFNAAGEDYVISGAQMIMSTQNISGSGILLNGDTGADGGSDVDSLVTFASSGTTDQDVIKIVDIGLITTVTNDQDVQLTFDVTVTDADGDTATDQFVINPTAEGLATSLMAASDASQEEQLQKSAANSNTLTLAAAVAAAGMAESAAASPPTDDQSLQVESDAGVSSQQVDMQLADGGDEGGSSVSSLADTFKAETASGDPAGRGRGNEHRSDNALDAASNQQPSDDSSSHQAANDQGPAVSQAATTPVAPDVAMVSAEMLIAAGLTSGTAKHNNVEEILADALGQGGAPTVDGLLAQLPGGLSELAANNNAASPAAGNVPGWDMAMHGGSGFAAEVLTRLDAAMLQHHDAVQPVING